MKRSDEARQRLTALIVSFTAGLLLLALAGLVLTQGFFADLLLDRNNPDVPYPFTLQNVMWMMFAVGLGEVWVHFRRAGREREPMRQRLLPESPEVMLRARDLGPIYEAVQTADVSENTFLIRLIRRTILQFQASNSVEQAGLLLNSSLELFHHEVDLRYNMLRYVVWLIPTLGFIGTVIGIASALNFAGSGEMAADDPRMLGELTKRLGVAFYTTLLALLQSSVLVFLLQVVQAREESTLNQAGQYCLDHLINRLYAE